RPTITSLEGTTDLGNVNDLLGEPVCPFPVDVVFVASTGTKQITFIGQGVGFAAMQNGHLTATLTNLDTGESITVNIPGPAFLDVNGSGLPVKGSGPSLLLEPIAEG